MNVYVDSSVALRHILSADAVLGRIAPTDRVASSDLLMIECQRVLQRERMEGHLDDHQYSEAVGVLEQLAEHLALIELGPAVKRRAAGTFPTVIGTLDALHLSTALLWQGRRGEGEVVILTYDRQLALCARAMGIRILNDQAGQS